MILKIRNPLELIKEITTLSDTLDAGSTTVEVKNTTGLVANDYVIIGKVGIDQAELKKISSVTNSGTFVLTSATSFPHGSGVIVQQISFNQIEISRKTTASGAWSVLTTIDIQVGTLESIYDDTSGQSTYFYRIRLYNATTGQYSDYSPELKGTGFSSRAIKPMIDTVLRRLRDSNGEYNSRESVLQEIIYQYDEIISRLIQSSSEFYRREIEIPTEPFKYEYTLPEDFREVHDLYDGDGTEVPPIPYDILRTTGRAGYELTDRNRIYFNDVPTPATDDVSPTTIISNDSLTQNGSWSVGDDGTNLTTDTDEYKVGTGALNFDIDVSQDADNKVTVTNSTITSVDLDTYEDQGKLRLWVYFPDVTYITSVNLKWGSDSTNTWDLTVTTDYKKHALRDGWNLLEFDWGLSTVTETGTPDASAVDYIQVTINYSASQPDDEDFRIDAIRIANAFSGDDVYRLVYFRQPATPSNEMDELDIPLGYSGVLLDGVVASLMIGYENRDTMSRELLRRSDDKKSIFNSQSSKRTRRPIGPRPFGRTRGYSRSGNFRSVHTNYDVYFPGRD